jgi:insulysin
LSYYMQVGRTTDQRTRVTLAILTQILAEPAFNVLRTKEQLGYVVACTQWYLSGASDAGMRIVVQSEKNPAYLEERVEAFLDKIKGVIKELSPEQFNEQKVGLQRKWREAHKNLGDELSAFWVQVDSGHLDFYRREFSTHGNSVMSANDIAIFLRNTRRKSP